MGNIDSFKVNVCESLVFLKDSAASRENCLKTEVIHEFNLNKGILRFLVCF